MAANDRPSTSSSSPPPHGSSRSSGDLPNGQSRDGRKRKRNETDMYEDTKGSRVASHDETVKGCSYRNMKRLVARGQYQKALAYTKINHHASSVSSKAKLQKSLKETMIFLIRDKRLSCEKLGLDYADMMMNLLSERLEDYYVDDAHTYNEFCLGAFLKPGYTETLLIIFVNKHTTNLKDKRRMFRIMFRGAEMAIEDDLQLISDLKTGNTPGNLHDLQEYQKELLYLVQILPATLHDDSDPAMSLSWLRENSASRTIGDYVPIVFDLKTGNTPGDLHELQEYQKELLYLVQILPATLHNDSDPAMSLSWLRENSASRTIGDYVPLFETAVELRLVQEAKLLYYAGAVNNAELMAVAKKPAVQKMLSDEEDQSKMAVFLRKVLKQPRSLESMAVLQVSRLVGQDVLGREDRVRQLPLSSTLRDAILLRPQLNRYRKEIECNDQGTDGGV